MSTIFDPDSFLDATIDAPSEKRPPLPVGDYTAVVGEVKAKTWQSKKDPTKSGIMWEVPLTVEIPAEVQASLGIEFPTLTLSDSIFLALTDNGGIDNGPGKNARLRQYREALNLNKPGDSFSARKMVGQPIRVAIKHELYEDTIFERVGAVTRV